jgi:hypothetical protein
MTMDLNLDSANMGEERRTTPVKLAIKVGPTADWINHVLKSSASTHGCQHIVENRGWWGISLPHVNKP